MDSDGGAATYNGQLRTSHYLFFIHQRGIHETIVGVLCAIL